jgi:hypothetical protein
MPPTDARRPPTSNPIRPRRNQHLRESPRCRPPSNILIPSKLRRRCSSRMWVHAVAKLHRHVCPRQVLGVRMAVCATRSTCASPAQPAAPARDRNRRLLRRRPAGGHWLLAGPPYFATRESRQARRHSRGRFGATRVPIGAEGGRPPVSARLCSRRPEPLARPARRVRTPH